MQLVDANSNPHIAGQEELPGKVNYFTGNNSDKWRPTFPPSPKCNTRTCILAWTPVYYGNQRQLEFDFVIAPGADPKAIRLGFDGLVGGQRVVPKINGISFYLSMAVKSVCSSR